MPKEIYLLDTTNATRNYDSVTGQIGRSLYHSFNVLFPLRTPILNLKKITLKSVEMPIILTTLRTQNNTITLGFKFSYGTYNNVYITTSLQDGFYTTSTLLSIINNTISGYVTPYGASIVLSTLSVYYGVVCQITHNCTSLTLDNSPLFNYILGYTNSFTALSSALLIGNSPINVNGIDTCVYINISNLPQMNNNISQPYTFKVPLNNLVNGVAYFNDMEEHQTVFFNKSNYALDKLNIVVYDRLGTVIIGYNNWTCTLLIEYEDGNEQQQFLNINN